MQDFSIATDFDASRIPLMHGADLDVVAVEAELSNLPHLDGDIRWDEPDDTERDFICAQQSATAAAALSRLPGLNQSSHLVISGRFALWDFVPAALALADGARIADLYIATLGFSKANIAGACDLLDAGTIGRLSLIASHYFKGTSSDIYEYGAAELGKRGQRFISIRSHAKIIAARFDGGRCLILESSANLRSCKNIEQVVASGHPDLFAFHAGWMESLLCAAASPSPVP